MEKELRGYARGGEEMHLWHGTAELKSGATMIIENMCGGKSCVGRSGALCTVSREDRCLGVEEMKRRWINEGAWRVRMEGNDMEVGGG